MFSRRLYEHKDSLGSWREKAAEQQKNITNAIAPNTSCSVKGFGLFQSEFQKLKDATFEMMPHSFFNQHEAINVFAAQLRNTKMMQIWPKYWPWHY